MQRAVPELSRLAEILLEARRAQGLELCVLADKLHLGKEQLEALETADLSRLPEPVFVIAQARRLAEVLDLDIEPQLLALRESSWRQQGNPRLNPAVPRPNQAGSPGQSPASPSTSRDPRAAILPLAAGCLAFAAIALAAYWGLQQAQPRQPAATAPKPAASQLQPNGQNKDVDTGKGFSLRSSPASWVAVRDSQGVTLFQGSLNSPRRFQSLGQLQVLAGRPDLVRATVGSRAERPLGSIGDVRWLTLR